VILPDVNLLVYAYNTADPRHDQARDWWEATVNGSVPVGLPWVVASGFIRLMTHPRLLERPLSAPEATRRIRAWLEAPGVTVIQPGRRFAELFLGFLDALGTAGNLTTDAQLAALAVEHQAEFNSNDTDFSRFPGLRWHNPLS
jgi:toxin-antitoxin system PIN domain toxin